MGGVATRWRRGAGARSAIGRRRRPITGVAWHRYHGNAEMLLLLQLTAHSTTRRQIIFAFSDFDGEIGVITCGNQVLD